jgi:uncharacterized MAPEG superfamily protein
MHQCIALSGRRPHPQRPRLSHLAKVATLKVSNRNDSGRVNPADFAGKLPKETVDRCARLAAAHQNGMESLILFSSGVAVCLATGAPIAAVNTLCKVHIASRVVFNVAYALPPVANGMPRSLAWAFSTGSAILLWLAAGRAYKN